MILMFKRLTSAVITIGFIFTQCGICFAASKVETQNFASLRGANAGGEGSPIKSTLAAVLGAEPAAGRAAAVGMTKQEMKSRFENILEEQQRLGSHIAVTVIYKDGRRVSGMYLLTNGVDPDFFNYSIFPRRRENIGKIYFSEIKFAGTKEEADSFEARAAGNPRTVAQLRAAIEFGRPIPGVGLGASRATGEAAATGRIKTAEQLEKDISSVNKGIFMRGWLGEEHIFAASRLCGKKVIERLTEFFLHAMEIRPEAETNFHLCVRKIRRLIGKELKRRKSIKAVCNRAMLLKRRILCLEYFINPGHHALTERIRQCIKRIIL